MMWLLQKYPPLSVIFINTVTSFVSANENNLVLSQEHLLHLNFSDDFSTWRRE